jgi:hypothetical protein
MFLRKLTPPIPPFEHVEKLKGLLEKHMQCFQSVSTGFDALFNKTLRSLSADAPPDAKVRYDLFIEAGRPISRPFRSFCEALQSLIGYLDDILGQRTEACGLLEVYQSKLARVRKEETDEAVAEEAESLVKFVGCLTKLNMMSNNFVIAFHTTYNSSWKQLFREVTDMSTRVAGIEKIPFDVLVPTNEEAALNEAIQGLRAEVDATK